MILHHAIGGEEVVYEVEGNRSHHEAGKGELCATGDISADLGSLVRMKDGALKPLHVLNCGILGSAVYLVQSVHSFRF